jgi:hypothetical protein
MTAPDVSLTRQAEGGLNARDAALDPLLARLG